MYVKDLRSIVIKLASPKDILSWSHGEVTKAETINYRTQLPEKGGLFSQQIFGPVKDYQCACGKYKGIRYKGIVCDKCGVEVTSSSVRRERMGHIKLASPVSHIWFLRNAPSIMSLFFGISEHELERVIYFAAYIITEVDEKEKKKILEAIDSEYKIKLNEFKKGERIEVKKEDLKQARDKAREELFSLQPRRVISEEAYQSLSEKYSTVFSAGTGAETLRKMCEKMDLKKISKEIDQDLSKKNTTDRNKLLFKKTIVKDMIKHRIRPEWMFLTILPVLPAGLRPMVQLDGGRYASSDLNDLYRRVINRNNRLKYLLDIDAPEVIVRNEKRMLQEAVDALIDNSARKGQTTAASTGGRRLLKSLADMLKGKKGRFRQNLLGKRVDYSGRSVITSGPSLKINECGLPKIIALELFKPFIISKLLKQGLAYNVRGALRLIEEQTEEVWKALEETVKDKYVLLNRAPTLHRLSIQAFKPKLIENEAIQLQTLACEPFNADFDGDQMPVYLPLSKEAQWEAKNIMLQGLNLLKPASGTPTVVPRLEMVLGCYWLTLIKEKARGEGKIFSSKNEAILASDLDLIDLRAKIKVNLSRGNIIETSVGRILFNNVLPKDYPFQNKVIGKKEIKEITSNVIENYTNGVACEVIDKVKDLGFEYATRSGVTWGMDDLIIPPQKKEIIEEADKKADEIEEECNQGLLSEEEKSSQSQELWQGVKEKIEKLIPTVLPPFGSISLIVNSGSRGSWAQPVQMAGMKGLVVNPAGKIIDLPIKSSYKEGFKMLEYFLSTHGTRKGVSDTALRTSEAGYLTRRLVDTAHSLIVTEEDCGDTEGIILYKEDSDKIGQDFAYTIMGRYILEGIKGIIKKDEIIDKEKAKKIVEAGITKVKVRSPLTCKSTTGICQKCYGWSLANNKLVKLGEAVGVVAAQSIGEPGTQLTLKNFHSGGVAGANDITQGLPRVEEIFENRIPKGQAVISHIDGKVVSIKKDKNIIRIEADKSTLNLPLKKKGKKKGKKVKEVIPDLVDYEIPPKRIILVKKGDRVKKGQPLCEGNINLNELFKLVGEKETQRYIISELQKVYVSQGVDIHNKHFETIVRQMFSRVKIIDSGDSDLYVGQVAERSTVLEKNSKLKKQGGKLIKYYPLILGISKVSLTTDSWLSAASFQETSRVLTLAAIQGKEDPLKGLKENVIIGKIIPAGTGYRRDKFTSSGKVSQKNVQEKS